MFPTTNLIYTFFFSFFFFHLLEIDNRIVARKKETKINREHRQMVKFKFQTSCLFGIMEGIVVTFLGLNILSVIAFLKL